MILPEHWEQDPLLWRIVSRPYHLFAKTTEKLDSFNHAWYRGLPQHRQIPIRILGRLVGENRQR